MKLVNVKTAKDAQAAIGYPGVEFVTRDGVLKEVHVGGLRIIPDYGTLQTFKHQPFEEEERHRVTYEVAGRKHSETFKEYSEAAEAARALRDKLDYDAVVQDTIKVSVDEHGNEFTGSFPEKDTEVIL